MFRWSLPWKLSFLVFLAKSAFSLLQFWKQLMTFRWFVTFSFWAAVYNHLNHFDSLNFNRLQVEVKFWCKQRGDASFIFGARSCVSNWMAGKLHARVAKTLETCLFSITACFFLLYLFTSATETNREFSLSAIFPTKFEFPSVFHIWSIARIWADNRWPPNQSNCLKSNNQWTVFNNNLLLAECEVRTASYGPSFFLPFMAQALGRKKRGSSTHAMSIVGSCG